ncbi:MAG: hypothetical protein ACO290_05770 [Ilumatobacteraceae bacterium]
MSGLLNYLKTRSVAVSLALVSGLLVVVANWSGVGWSWDTSDYVAVGKNFASGNGLLDATGIPMTVRPPGLSILIGVGDLLGLSVNLTVQILNVVCAIVTVLGTFHLLQIAKVKKNIALIATTFVAFSPALLWQYSMIWSEPPFIALVVIAMIVALKPVSASKFTLLVVLFAALFFVRYVGPVFAASIALSAAWFDRQKLGLIKSALMNFAILLVSLIPVWYWLQRNESIDGTLTGARTPAGGSLLNPLKTFTATLGSWMTASPVEGGIYLSWNDYPNNTKILGVLVLVTIAILLIIYFLLQSQAENLKNSSNVLLLSGSIAVIYVAFSAYRFVHFELGPLDNRMMIPIFVPLVLVVALLVDRINLSSTLLRKGFLAIFVMFLVFQALSSANDALRFGRDGRYWAAEAFQIQPIHKFVKNLPTDSSLMSNLPQQLFAVWQKSSVFNQYQLELAQTAECTHRYFVWYNSTYDDGTPNVEGRPEGATEIYSDASGVVLDLGTCNSDITAFWP